MEKAIKIGLATLILVVFFIPLKRNVLHFIKERPLFGSYKTHKEPKLSLKGWLEGSFQKDYSTFFNADFGFRNTLVRTYNQTQYSLYNKTTAKDVQIGKENYLFEGGYIRDYMGYNFIGEERITERLQKLKTIQEELKQENISFIVAFAPGKASYYPEYFPANYEPTKKTLSNYLCYTQTCKELDLDYIDYNALFMKHKIESDLQIFPKGGVHWGEYGVVVSLDSLSRYLERERGISMPMLEMEDPVYYDTLKGTDRDISDAMNLLFEWDFYKMPTPQYTVKYRKNDIKPRLLIIGDSYGYGLTNSPLINELYSSVEFWYYNREIKSGKENHGTKIDDINVRNQMNRFDVILLLSTETNLYKFDFGFAESYYQGDEEQREKEIQRLITRIKKDTTWFTQLKEQAKERGFSINESLRKNAIFVISNRKRIK